VKAVLEVMGEKYRELTAWLHQFDLGRDELKETLPGLYLDIQDCIQRLDKAFINEDLIVFRDAVGKVKLLYTEALFKCDRRIAGKVWSEVLGCHLWIVETDKDMDSLRSQGITEAIYRSDEIRKIKGMDKDSLKAIQRVKETFPGSKIEHKKLEGNKK